MTLGKVIVLAIIGILAAFFVAFALPMAHARAAECERMDDVVAKFIAAGAQPFIIPADRLPKTVEDAEQIIGQPLPQPSRGFLVVTPRETVLGLEVDGCLLPPIVMETPKADARAELLRRHRLAGEFDAGSAVAGQPPGMSACNQPVAGVILTIQRRLFKLEPIHPPGTPRQQIPAIMRRGRRENTLLLARQLHLSLLIPSVASWF